MSDARVRRAVTASSAAEGRARRPVLRAACIALVTLARLLAAQQPLPTLPLRADLRIRGAREGLSTVSAIAVGRDGTMTVWQPEDMQLRRFDRQGRPLATIGRRGSGPDEFAMLGPHGWLGDTLWIADPRNRRTMFIGPRHRVHRSAPWPATGRDGTMLDLFAITARGEMIVRAASRGTTSEGFPLLRRGSDGRAGLAVAYVPDGPPAACLRPWRSGRTQGESLVPFCGRPFWDIAKDGSRIVMATQDPIAASRGAPQYRIVVLDATGDTLVARRFRETSRLIPRDVLDSAVARRARGPRPTLTLATLRGGILPVAYPPVVGLLLGRDGTIWVGLRSDDARPRWTVLGADGTPLARIVLPPRARLVAAERSTLWVIEPDPDGVHDIVRYHVPP